MVLDVEDIIDSSEVDAEILGAGTVMAFTIVNILEVWSFIILMTLELV